MNTRELLNEIAEKINELEQKLEALSKTAFNLYIHLNLVELHSELSDKKIRISQYFKTLEELAREVKT